MLSILLLLSLLIFSLSNAWDPKGDYKHAVFPCETECARMSSGLCFTTSWRTPAAWSRTLSVGCQYVMYSISLGSAVAGINGILDYWGGKPCSFMFLSRHSELVKNARLKNLHRMGNWTVLLVDDFPNFVSLRRAGKIPKFAPNFFFSKNVSYAMYLDSKYQLKVNPIEVIQNYSSFDSNVVLSAFRHPKNPSFENEHANILRSAAKRPTITDDLSKVNAQVENYTNSEVISQLRTEGRNQVMIEAGMLIHKMHDKRGNVFRCAWLDQVQQWSDRDQVAFPFMVAHFNGGKPYLNNTLTHPAYNNDSFMVPLQFKSHGGDAYINLIPARYYWRNKRYKHNFGNISYETWHEKIDIQKQATAAAAQGHRSLLEA